MAIATGRDSIFASSGRMSFVTVNATYFRPVRLTVTLNILGLLVMTFDAVIRG